MYNKKVVLKRKVKKLCILISKLAKICSKLLKKLVGKNLASSVDCKSTLSLLPKILLPLESTLR